MSQATADGAPQQVARTDFYREIRRNKWRTFVILLAFVALIVLAGIAVDILLGFGAAGVVIAFVFALGMAFVLVLQLRQDRAVVTGAKPGRRARVPALPQPRRRAVHRRGAAEAAALCRRRRCAERVRHRSEPEALRVGGDDGPVADHEPRRARRCDRARALAREELRHPRFDGRGDRGRHHRPALRHRLAVLDLRRALESQRLDRTRAPQAS